MHQSLKILPGVDVNKTPALNEAAISECQLIRFIPDRTLGGLVQQIGGWSKYPNETASFVGSTVRALWAWQDTGNNSYLGVGADGIADGGGKALEIISNTIPTDITPRTLVVNDIAITVQTTYGSNAVVITDTDREITSNDSVWIKNPISVGGIILFGLYQCYNPGNSPSEYTIYASSNASLPATTTGATGNGTTATVTYSGSYQFAVGSTVVIDNIIPAGYQGTHTVTSSSPGSVSFASTTTAAQTTAGIVYYNATVPGFETEAASNNVTVTFPSHGYEVGDTFPILIPVSVGGISLSGNYTVTRVVSTDQFIISVVSSAPATEGPPPVLENDGYAWYQYFKGQDPNLPGLGYGIGSYGVDGYGGAVSGITPSPYPGTPINAIDWTLDNWGEIFISCPFDGAIYEWSPTQGQSIATAIAGAPPVNAGMFVAMPQRQIIAWGSTFNGIKDPLLIRWCDVENYENWTVSPTGQAGYYRIPKGSKIVQCIQGPQQGLVWTDLGLWAMQYVGPPYVYQFSEVGTGCGLIGRRAATSVNGVIYWMGQSQFYKLSGSGVEPIKCPIWDVVFQDLDRNNLDRIRVAPNSRFGEIAWYFPSASNNGENEGYVKYNFILDQWDYGFNTTSNPYVARSAWINESVLGPPIGAGLNQYLYQHEVSQNADGVAMNSYFQTGYFALTEADVLMFIDQVWPDMKWGYYGGDQGANIRLTFYVTSYAGQSPEAYGPYTMIESTTYLTPRFRGRLVSIKIESNDINSWWRLGNIRYRIQQDGKFL